MPRAASTRPAASATLAANRLEVPSQGYPFPSRPLLSLSFFLLTTQETPTHTHTHTHTPSQSERPPRERDDVRYDPYRASYGSAHHSASSAAAAAAAADGAASTASTPPTAASAAAPLPSARQSLPVPPSAAASLPAPAYHHNDASSDPSRWSVDRVQKWLVQNGAAKHAPLFGRHEVDGGVLVALTASDLIDELRIPSLRERKELLRLVGTVQQPSPQQQQQAAAAASHQQQYQPQQQQHGGAAVPSSAALAELAQHLEAETAIVQSVVQSEARRVTAALQHDVAALRETVLGLQRSVEGLEARMEAAWEGGGGGARHQRLIKSPR